MSDFSIGSVISRYVIGGVIARSLAETGADRYEAGFES